jgi:4-amino-4-deoxy-L-arabinose transferase-like glycosyltransferase
LLVAAFQMLNVWWLHMHPDEGLSYTSTAGDLAYVITWQTSLQDNQAPGWFMLFWAWQQVMGQTEFASRALGWVTMLLALAVGYRVGRRALGSAFAASLGVICLAGNAFFFQYAFDIRPYPLVMLVTMLSLWAFQRWLHRPDMRRSLMYGVAVAAMLYVHYLLALFVVLHVLFAVLHSSLTRQPLSKWVSRLRGLLIAGIVAALLFAPWLPTFVAHVQHLRNIEAETGTARGVAGIGVSTFATTPETINDFVQMATNGMPLLYVAVILIGIMLYWRRAGWWLVLLAALGVPMLYLLVNAVAAVYAPRFISYMMIPLALLIGATLARLPGRIAHLPLGIVVAGVWLMVHLVTFGAGVPERIPYRNIFREISRTAQADEIVFFEPMSSIDGHLQRQIDMYLTVPVTPDLETALVTRRIWFASGFQLEPEAQEVFGLIEPSHPLQRVLGRCFTRWCFVAQLMEAPPMRDVQLFAGQLGFSGADVDTIAANHVNVRLWWRADVPIALDYSIGLQLLAANGVLVAQSDGSINHYNSEIVPTSQMEAGKLYIDYRRLVLPAGLAAGAYRLQVVVYQSWDGVRLTVDGVGDSVLVAMIPLPPPG